MLFCSRSVKNRNYDEVVPSSRLTFESKPDMSFIQNLKVGIHYIGLIYNYLFQL